MDVMLRCGHLGYEIYFCAPVYELVIMYNTFVTDCYLVCFKLSAASSSMSVHASIF